MIKEITKTNSLLSVFVAELRDVAVQNDSLRFRRNMERIGEILGYELSKTLEFTSREIQTPLGSIEMHEPADTIVLGTILRAGLPMHTGLHNYFDRAENAIISAYRKHTSEVTFDIEVDYLSSPSIEGKILILCDPMLATGNSMVICHKTLCQQRGTPKHTHIVSAIGSEQGVQYTMRNLPLNTTLWIGAIDPELNAKSYIVPGLGDAGDLAFGEKI